MKNERLRNLLGAMLLGLALPTLAVAAPGYAKRDQPVEPNSFVPRHLPRVVKVNPLAIYFPALTVSYEQVLSAGRSFQLGVTLGERYMNSPGGVATNYLLLGITPEYRFYCCAKPAPLGYFVAPFARLRYIKASLGTLPKLDGNQYSEAQADLGFTVGKTMPLCHKATFELFAGPYVSYNNRSKGEGGRFSDFGLQSGGFNTGLRLGVNFGYRL